MDKVQNGLGAAKSWVCLGSTRAQRPAISAVGYLSRKHTIRIKIVLNSNQPSFVFEKQNTHIVSSMRHVTHPLLLHAP